MKRIFLALVILFLFYSSSFAQQWVTGYWACWAQGQSNSDPRIAGAIDWNTYTHIVHQQLDPVQSQIPDATHPEARYFTYGCGYASWSLNLRAMIDSAHAHGRKAIIGLGGTSGHAVDFDWIVANGHLEEYVSSIMGLIRNWGYDGVDFDIEPPLSSAAGVARTYQLLRVMHDSLVAVRGDRHSISFALPPWHNQWTLRADSALKYIDQFNVMNYDYSLNSQGTVTEHNAPLYPYNCPITPGRFDQTSNVSWQDSMYWSTVHGGGGGLIPKSKLGVGLAFYGYRWRATDLCAPGGGVNSTTSYAFIHDQYKTPALAYRYHWDDVAKVPYLAWSDASVMPGGAGATEKFVTFDDTNSIAIKARWAKDNGYGGLMVWALYYEEAGHPLINAVNKGLGGGVITPPKPDTTIIPPPPPTPTVSVCDTAYQRGFMSGKASVVCPPLVVCPPCPDTTIIWMRGFNAGKASIICPVAKRDTIYIDGIDPLKTYSYFSTSLTDSAVNVYLKSGAKFLYMGTKSSTTGKVPVRGYKP